MLRSQEFDCTEHYITRAENIAAHFSRDVLYNEKLSKIIDIEATKQGTFIIKTTTKQNTNENE